MEIVSAEPNRVVFKTCSVVLREALRVYLGVNWIVSSEQ